MAAARSATPHPADLLRSTWERQRPALAALLALAPHLCATRDPDFADSGIDAWRALAGQLDEPLVSFLDAEPLRLLAELESDTTPRTIDAKKSVFASTRWATRGAASA
ncbi:hypothetical protein [Candidatus Accumulibacter cognatus]|uniref:Uncharacterized protein n=1 Tax=Candidatus Accumulibacter cognatus TaxID=2954383 RepID=A0A080M4X7_9PROT|nr:hypothetical protein [Candidatus Accumulibacter cognatus]KFB76263.1 MAG: hypothetical protein AW06_002685 [Candidatus Accumulibacter cognatus]QLH51378.1 MAG: hypothetical protein HWD57_17380 [Candidatus Accumulibacter cognatus]